jgi:outer membrane protein, heavy metal efflux system
MFRSITALIALILLPGVRLGAQQQADLSIHEVYALALERNPMIHAARAAADGAAARESASSLPPDPRVELAAMNLSLPSLSTDMPSAMLPSIQVMQMIPLGGKLGLEGEVARQTTAMALNEAEEVGWRVRTRAAMAFYRIYQIDRSLVTMEETLDWLRQLEGVATTMYTVGSGNQGDVLRAAVEVARMEADIARMRAMRAGEVARLNALLDRPSDTPVSGVSFEPLPASLPLPEALLARAEAARPLLEGARTGVERAEAREALARREIWPDLSLGVGYGQRPSGMGTDRMASFMVGFTVPIFAGRRQYPMRAETAAMSEMARAELAEARAGVRARIGELLAGLDRARTLLTLYRTEVLPQAEANVTASLASYRVGRADFMTLVDAQMGVNDFEQQVHELLAEYGTMIAELEMAIGGELPVGADTIEEGP